MGSKEKYSWEVINFSSRRSLAQFFNGPRSHSPIGTLKPVLGFSTKYTVKDAVLDLKKAFEEKLLTNTFDNEYYYNIKRMNNINLK